MTRQCASWLSSMTASPYSHWRTEMAVLHVSCAAEGRYVPHSAAMLHSVLTHSDDYDVHVHYLHGPSFSSLHASQLEEMVAGLGGEISFHCIPDSAVRGLPVLP